MEDPWSSGQGSADIVLPLRSKGNGYKIFFSISKANFPGFDISKTFGIQVVMQSIDGFAPEKNFVTRKVNQYEGQQRFGGGHDGECDPHVMDTLTGSATGQPGKYNYSTLCYNMSVTMTVCLKKQRN